MAAEAFGTGPLLPLLHRDARRVAIHKPSGLHTHPSALSPREDSAARWLSQQLECPVHPVHRLDRGASGLLLFTLDPAAAHLHAQAFRQHQVRKVYLALVRGWLDADEGVVERPLKDLDPASSKPREQEALTRWRVVARGEAPFCGGRGDHAFPTTRLSLVECRPETGRMHQIRRHMNGLGHPLLGDGEHGDRHLNRMLARECGLARLALVCTQLDFPTLDGMEALHLDTRVDPDLRRVLERLALPDPTRHVAGPLLFDGVVQDARLAWRERRGRVEAMQAGAGPLPAGRARPHLQPWAGSLAPCPLCGGSAAPFHAEASFRWLACPDCGLVHRSRDQWPTPEDAAMRLALHRNSALDEGYRTWLKPFVEAVRHCLPSGGRGLDVGCGPAPVLAQMLQEAGFACASWDPQFAPESPTAPVAFWDFITLSEVFEHLSTPLDELIRWRDALRPGGWLVLGTGLLERDEAFPGWWYARDATHLIFARPLTFEWLAARLGMALERRGRLMLLRKQGED